MEKDKRCARRIHLPEPVEASLSHMPVMLLDLSTSGARLRHDSPLVFSPEKRFVLEFQYDRERFTLGCQIARSRIEPDVAARRLRYISGVWFVDLNQDTTAALWGLLATLAIGHHQEQAASGELPLEFDIITH